MASECARRGAKVILACRNKQKAEGLVTQLRKKTGNEDIHFLPLDLASFGSIKEFVELFAKHYGKAFALVNNAGKIFHIRYLDRLKSLGLNERLQSIRLR